MTQINWGVLGQPQDAGIAFQQAFEHGKQLKKQQATEDVLAQYGANPAAGIPGALWALDPAAAGAVSRDSRERVVAQRATEDALRQTTARATYADALRGTLPATGAGVLGGVPAAAGAPTDANGDIVVTANAPPAPHASVADVAALDPKLAQDLTEHMGTLAKNDREAFAQKWGVGAAVAQAASRISDLAARQAYLDDHTPLLKHSGFSDEELAGFDPHDENLRAVVGIGVGADKVLADDRSAAGQAVTVRGQDVSASTARRGQDISASTARRGQDMSAATAAAGQAVSMRGQDMAAASKVAPKPATMALARTKLTSLNAISNQLDRAEKALAKAKYTGPIAGRLPGGISGADDAADAALAGLAPLVRQLTRVPGEGAMSDYESRLAQAGIPSRSQTAAGRQEAISQLRALVDQSRAGYHDLIGETPTPSARGFKVVR